MKQQKALKRFPIGIQAFSNIIEDDYLYYNYKQHLRTLRTKL